MLRHSGASLTPPRDKKRGIGVRDDTIAKLDSETAFAPEKLNPGEDPLQLLRDRPLFLEQGGGLDALIQSLTIPAPMLIR